MPFLAECENQKKWAIATSSSWNCPQRLSITIRLTHRTPQQHKKASFIHFISLRLACLWDVSPLNRAFELNSCCSTDLTSNLRVHKKRCRTYWLCQMHLCWGLVPEYLVWELVSLTPASMIIIFLMRYLIQLSFTSGVSIVVPCIKIKSWPWERLAFRVDLQNDSRSSTIPFSEFLTDFCWAEGNGTSNGVNYAYTLSKDSPSSWCYEVIQNTLWGSITSVFQCRVHRSFADSSSTELVTNSFRIGGFDWLVLQFWRLK